MNLAEGRISIPSFKEVAPVINPEGSAFLDQVERYKNVFHQGLEAQQSFLDYVRHILTTDISKKSDHSQIHAEAAKKVFFERYAISEDISHEMLLAQIDELQDKLQQEQIQITRIKGVIKTPSAVSYREALPQDILKIQQPEEMGITGMETSLSAMDSIGRNLEELEGKGAGGKIYPPVPSTSFVYEIATPTARGLSPRILPTDLQYDENYAAVKGFIQNIPQQDHSLPNQIKISSAGSIWEGETIPMPLGGRLVAVDQSASCIINHPSDPLTTRLVKGHVNEYYIEKDKRLIQLNTNEFTPSQAEQEYWSAVLPLPEQIKEHAKKFPEDIPSLIAGHLRKHFYYVNHKTLGDFLRHNSDELPLIMDELQMGHCDYLSWVSSVYFRQLGIPAIITHEKVTTKDGTAFAVSGHARVQIPDRHHNLQVFDATTFCEVASSLDNYFPQELFEAFKKKYAQAENEQEKRHLLRDMRLDIMRVIEKYPNQAANLAPRVENPVEGVEFVGQILPVSFEEEHARIEKTHQIEISGDTIQAYHDLYKGTQLIRELDLSELLYRVNEIRHIVRICSEKQIAFGDIPTITIQDDIKDIEALLRGDKIEYLSNLGEFLFNPIIAKDFSERREEIIQQIKDIEDFYALCISPEYCGEIYRIEENISIDFTHFSFSPEFENVVYTIFQEIDMNDLEKMQREDDELEDFAEDVLKNKLGTLSMDKKLVLEEKIFWRLYYQAFTNKKVQRKLEETFGIPSKFWRLEVKNIAPIYSRNRSPRKHIPASNATLRRILAEYEENNEEYELETTYSELAMLFHIPEKQKRVLKKKIFTLLKKHANIQKGGNDFLSDPEEYNPDIHRMKDIIWSASVRRPGKNPVARRVKDPEQKKQPLYIAFEDILGGFNINDKLAQELFLDTVQEFVKKYKYPIYITEQGYGGIYYEILPNTDMRLLKDIFHNVCSEESHDLRITEGKKTVIPEHLLCITARTRTRDALNAQKKGVAFTWNDLGLRTYPEVNEPI
ncbi:hypothetical protein KKG22_01025 [Patescibacteria group bacterium]|nr:hypothetical protein [Patescibacteria group bacterium]MBU1722018.1 hypothetical protein [Patescibacteria group bacterium]MBU1901232.1 hypothetical protein [Patescibacteria group bacterium]